jgi:glucokinase
MERILNIDIDQQSILGIDIGGTKTSVCTADRSGRIRHAQRMPSEAQRGPQDWLERTVELCHRVMDEAAMKDEDVEMVGISAPGPLSARTGTLLNAPNMTGWEEVPIVEMLSQHFAQPMVMNNDANAAALAEWYFGEYKGADGLIYLTMSTGLGAGIIANGRLLQGITDTAGEVGYHVLDIHGPQSPCGHRGSFEAFCGGKNMADRLRQQIVDDRIETRILEHAEGDPEKIDFRCLLQAVRDEDAFAREVWEEYVLRLAQGMANLIMILNPEVIILGTIGIHAGHTLLNPLQDMLPCFTLKPALEACTIAPSSLGKQIGDMAAVALALERLDAREP